MMDEYWRKDSQQVGREDDNVVVFKKEHDKAYATSYAAINKTESTVQVNLDMTDSVGCAFTPSKIFLKADWKIRKITHI